MKRIHSIIYQETLSPVIITLVVLTFVVFTREFGRLAELFIRKNATLTTIFKAVIYLMPSVLIFTIPFAFLIGTLIGFSRLSSDSEIIAMRAGGVSVYQMLWPVLKIALLIVGITAAFTLFLLPGGNWKLRQLRHEIRASPVQSELKPRVFFEEFPGILIYVEDIDLDTSTWEGIFVADTTDSLEKRVILAQKGTSILSEDGRRLQLHFERGSIYTTLRESPEQVTISRFGTLDIPVDLRLEEANTEREKRSRDKTLSDLLLDLNQGPPEDRRESLVELNRRIALPLSALIFAVLAVTLGGRNPRGGRGYGFVVGVSVGFVYYILFATGSTLSKNGVIPLLLGVWGANLLLGAFAALSLRSSNRELGILHSLTARRLFRRPREWSRRAFRAANRSFSGLSERRRRLWRHAPSLRVGLASVIDLYMIRLFSVYFAVTLGICLSLVSLFTFFELIDDIFTNDIAYSTVLDYFFFLQPHLLNLLVPISVLIATLVTFSSLEKTNQVVALKSCGISVYRAAGPVFAMGLLLSAFLFITQEHILPYANQRQDELRHRIKGSPVQTTQPGRHWIFGRDDRLYNYNLFNAEQNRFAELSIYELEIADAAMEQMIYGRQAVWDRTQQRWRISEGWVRDFGENRYETFEQRLFELSETPSYFSGGVQESSKMTYGELERYISDLQQGGFEVDYLKTELYKKLSFPLVNVIMTLLGLPFALTLGRKGALYGLAAGVFIGILYWGAFGVFDVLGANGLLAPLLAAWGPNIVFGAGAGILLSGVRT